MTALRCLRDDGQWVLTREVARRTGLPSAFLAKLLHQLSTAGLIEGKRGYQGGFRLTRPAAEISLLDVIEAVEGRPWQLRPLLGLDPTAPAARDCPTASFWGRLNRRLVNHLSTLTLADVHTVDCRPDQTAESFAAVGNGPLVPQSG